MRLSAILPALKSCLWIFVAVLSCLVVQIAGQMAVPMTSKPVALEVILGGWAMFVGAFILHVKALKVVRRRCGLVGRVVFDLCIIADAVSAVALFLIGLCLMIGGSRFVDRMCGTLAVLSIGGVALWTIFLVFRARKRI